MPPRTIDNLGVDVSTRYAEDKKLTELGPNLVKESAAIPVQTAIQVTTPYFPSELESLLRLLPGGITWASFPPPANYFEQRKQLFSFQLIPSMGLEDKKESQAQKILAKIQAMTEANAQEQIAHPDKRKEYETKLALEEEEKEKKILTTLLHQITVLDKLIIDINDRRSQYQKG